MLDVFVETVVQLLMIYTIVARSVSSYRNDVEKHVWKKQYKNSNARTQRKQAINRQCLPISPIYSIVIKKVQRVCQQNLFPHGKKQQIQKKIHRGEPKKIHHISNKENKHQFPTTTTVQHLRYSRYITKERHFY